MFNPGISIIICCYNSELLIKDALQSIALQKFSPGIQAEVIIVDNNCTDDTVAIAKSYWDHNAQTALPLKIVTENQPGLTHARQRGMQQAAYEYLIFCDDDNRLEAGYIEAAFRMMKENSSIGAAGGVCNGISNENFPEWWPTHAHAYAVGRQGNHTADISRLQYVWGAGMVVKKTVLQKVLHPNFPLLLTDRKGMMLSSGGDSEICARILLLGYQLWFNENLRLQHFIHPNKLTTAYRDKLYQGHHAATTVLEKYRHVIIENSLRGIFKIKRTIKLFFQIIFSRQNKEYNKTALNVLANTNYKLIDEDYKTILAFVKFAKA